MTGYELTYVKELNTRCLKFIKHLKTMIEWDGLILPPINLYNVPKMNANDKQIGGDHYKKYKGLEPWDVVLAWNLGYLEGTALKYIARWRDKNGIEDLKKAIHFLEKLIEVEGMKPQPGQVMYNQQKVGDGTVIFQDKSIYKDTIEKEWSQPWGSVLGSKK
jgi:hypothetical protein